MKITYIINLPFEFRQNAAAVNRIRAFKKGIEENGEVCNILFPRTKKRRSPIHANIIAFNNVFRYLMNAKKNEIIIFYGASIYLILIVLFKHKLKFLVEANEFPYHLINPNYRRRFNTNYKFLLKFLVGFITCSYTLKNYYEHLLSEDTPIHIAPLVINIEEFTEKIKYNKNQNSYIGYCGSFGNNKDGLPNLIRSFFKIADEYKSLNLHIAGTGSKKVEENLNNLVNELALNNRVIFLGNVSYSDMPSFLGNARLLVLARPSNKQAEGGFPSKIAEYMAVKVPIVVTNVGELQHYLRDGDNCFMAVPDSIESFSQKMVEALEDKNKETIVSNAFATVQQFNSLEQAKLLIEFLKKI